MKIVVDELWVAGGADCLWHAGACPPNPQGLPSASVQAIHTPERLESTLTREILACQKSGNSEFLD